MVYRTRAIKKVRPRSVKRSAPPPASTPWPTIEAFFQAGESDISIGAIDHIPGLRHTAVASDEHNMLVALVRNPGETTKGSSPDPPPGRERQTAVWRRDHLQGASE